MERYISQLIDDLRNCKANVPPAHHVDLLAELFNPSKKKPVAPPTPIRNIRVSDLIGIEKMYFPHPDKLSDDQLGLVTNEFCELLETFYLYPCFPAGLPSRLKFPLLMEYLDKEIEWFGVGKDLHFCDGNPDNCPYPEEYCECNNEEDDSGDQTGLYEPDEYGILFDLRNRGAILYLNGIMQLHEQSYAGSGKDKQRLAHLLRDFDEAAANASWFFDELFKMFDRMLDNDSRSYDFAFMTMEEITRIPGHNIPHPDELHPYEQALVMRGILSLMASYHVTVDFHVNVPLEYHYQILLDAWEEVEINMLLDDEYELELCTHDILCPFNVFCDCPNKDSIDDLFTEDEQDDEDDNFRSSGSSLDDEDDDLPF